ncbi:MAG: AMP-binding protein, partial [Planctomycetota bacterium]
MADTGPPPAQTLPDLIRWRAEKHGQRIALKFLSDDGASVQWTYQELWSRCVSVAGKLAQLASAQPENQQPGRVLLLFPPGLDFMAGFIGVQIAGLIPVPTCYPKPGREMPRLDSAARDCRPLAIVIDEETLVGLDEDKLCDEAASAAKVTTTRPTDAPDAIDLPKVDPDS